MIKSLRLKAGPSETSESEEIEASPITVFVGPNNSGKSQVLRDIAAHCSGAILDSSLHVLRDLVFNTPSSEEIADIISNYEVDTIRGLEVVKARQGFHIPVESLHAALQDPNNKRSDFYALFLDGQIINLEGSTRINLTNQQAAGDLTRPPSTTFQVLFHDDIKRAEVQRIVLSALDCYLVVDPTQLGTLKLRLSSQAPVLGEERSLASTSIDFYRNAQPIETASDGIKAFTGIISMVVAGDPRILLLDEPEAFLHPSLATKLGYELARAAQSNDKRIFAATHSSAFLMGCIQSGVPMNIVRLTYQRRVATSRLLPSKKLGELMRHPLLRSTNVLAGLFHSAVVVTESDADRAFYQEINERLLQEGSGRGIKNCLFLNAQNKQTVPTIVEPLRQLGIPAVAIVDVDVFKEGGQNWTKHLSSIAMPELSQRTLELARSGIKDAMDKSGKNMKRDGGVSILAASQQEAARSILEQLAAYGMFVVPGGELESWLQALGATGHGPAWLIKVFEAMGEDPTSASYVRPAKGDVWDFVEGIAKWVADPLRKGIPSASS